MCPIEGLPYVAAFRALNEVVRACFGSELSNDFLSRILYFKQLYLDLEIGVTPKVHTVFFHVPTFCENRGVGLGRHSEQASESVHSDFGHIWKKYKVNDNHPDYGSRLLRAVVEYNSNHV